MGLNIWHELDMHSHPVTQKEVDLITRWAAIGKSELLSEPSQPDINVLAGFVDRERANPKSNSLTRFIGFTIGMHAGRQLKPIAEKDDTGYEFPTLARIRETKILGKNAAELDANAEFITAIGDALDVAARTNSQLQVSEDFLGYGMGFREVRIIRQGAEV